MKPSELSFVHRWEPSGASQAPTLLLLHGTGGTEDDLIELGRALLPNANLLSPRGQVNENGQLRFFRRLAEGVFDLDDLHARTKQLAQFVADSAAVYGFDANRVVAVGFSNGANIAASLLLGGYRTLAGAALLHPMVPFEPAVLPELKGTAAFIGAGQSDPLVPIPLTERLEELLRAAGADVELHWHAGGHRLTRDEVEAASTWIRKGEQSWN